MVTVTDNTKTFPFKLKLNGKDEHIEKPTKEWHRHTKFVFQMLHKLTCCHIDIHHCSLSFILDNIYRYYL